MKTHTQRYQPGVAGTTHHLVTGPLLGVLLAPFVTTAGAGDSFLHNALLNPTRGQLETEARGRIMIYDGVDNEVVESAFDEQFDRLEHMMFVRIRHTGPDGEISVQDDGCD